MKFMPTKYAAQLLLLLAGSSLASAAPKTTKTFHSDGNPILGDGTYFSADAAPLSANGKLYIYAGHDEPPPEVGGFVMYDYGVFVTEDPKSGDWELYQNNHFDISKMRINAQYAVHCPENHFRVINATVADDPTSAPS